MMIFLFSFNNACYGHFSSSYYNLQPFNWIRSIVRNDKATSMIIEYKYDYYN